MKNNIISLVCMMIITSSLFGQIKIWNNGKVGINTTLEPKEIFQIGSNWTFGNGDNKCINSNTYWDISTSSVKRISDGYCSSLNFNSDGSIALRVGSTGTGGQTVTMNNVLNVTNNQRVGVGVDVPQDKLDVNGNIRISQSNKLFFVANGSIMNADDNHGIIFGNYPTNVMYFREYGDMEFQAGYNQGGTSTKMIIKANGNVGIGVTNPSDKLTVAGNLVPSVDASYTCGKSGQRWFQIWAWNGTIQTSDIRCKTNIKELDYGLKEIMKLRPITFNWKDKDNGKRIGLIAQELQSVIGEVVITGDDENKNLGVIYTELIPVLIKGIQEQQKIIEDQNVRINALEQNSNLNNITNSNLNNNSIVAKLFQNNPNPFSQNTEVKCIIPNDVKNVELFIYDMQGIQIKKISISGKGEVNTIIQGSELKAGMYMYALIIDGKEIDTKRMILTN